MNNQKVNEAWNTRKPYCRTCRALIKRNSPPNTLEWENFVNCRCLEAFK